MYHSYDFCVGGRFRIYLIGIHFMAVTDCAFLRATLVKRELVPRIARWCMVLQEYDMEIKYRPEAKMLYVDVLSRNPVMVNLVNISTEDWFLTVQMQDSKALSIINTLNQGVADNGL